MTSRRFPPPWTVEERAAAFAVCDANGHALAYVYFEDEPGQALRAAKLLAVKGRSGFRPIPLIDFH